MSVEVDMYPLLASPVVPGFPITSLSRSTPLAAIWKSALSGQDDDDEVRRPEQVVYSVVPSEQKSSFSICDDKPSTYGYRTRSPRLNLCVSTLLG